MLDFRPIPYPRGIDLLIIKWKGEREEGREREKKYKTEKEYKTEINIHYFKIRSKPKNKIKDIFKGKDSYSLIHKYQELLMGRWRITIYFFFFLKKHISRGNTYTIYHSTTEK